MRTPRRTSRLLVVLLVAAVAALANPSPATAADSGADPTAGGPHDISIIEYNAGPTVVAGGLEVWHDELRGALFVPSGPGPFPVLLFLHGKDRDCAERDPDPTTYPSEPVDLSCRFAQRFALHRGFDYLATNLASHGFLVASVLTHAGATTPSGGALFTDGGRYARAEILSRTLDLLAQWNAGPAPGDVVTRPSDIGTRLAGRVDLTRIGAMGHSRGGEGVTELIDHAQTRVGTHYRLSAVLSIAPTTARHRTPHGVPYATIVPPCDGDVRELEGAYLHDWARFVDPEEPAPRMQFVVRGGNHNFFNTLWQNTDDGVSAGAGCDTNELPTAPYRLTYAEQQRIGLALVAGFFRRYVRGETAFDPLMTGAAGLPSTACPHGQTTCPDAVGTSYLAPAGDRAMVVLGDALLTSGGVPLALAGFAESRVCEPTPQWSDVEMAGPVLSHTADEELAFVGQPSPGDTLFPPPTDRCPTDPTRSAARQLALRWDGAATLGAPLSATPLGTFDASRFTALTFRTGVNVPVHGNPMPDVDVVLRDAYGRKATVAATDWTAALRPPDGQVEKRLVLNGVRLPLRAFHGVRLERLTRVELHFGRTGPGSVQLAELMFQVS